MKKHYDEPFCRLTPAELREMLEEPGSNGLQLVHLGNPSGPEGPCIPGSIRIPWAWVAQRLAELEADRPIILVCAVGARSAFAAEMACSLGKEDVYHLEGGIAAWVKEGYPVEGPNCRS